MYVCNCQYKACICKICNDFKDICIIKVKYLINLSSHEYYSHKKYLIVLNIYFLSGLILAHFVFYNEDYKCQFLKHFS